MFKHILIATDGSELADKAVVQGLTLAKALNAKATAVTVTEPWDALSMAAIAEAQCATPSPIMRSAWPLRGTASCRPSERRPRSGCPLRHHIREGPPSG